MKVSNVHQVLSPFAATRAALLVTLVVLGAASGCATENKVTRAPGFALSHPDYWKVESVATKAGEPTKVMIGKFSETVINEGVGATASALYESSQAEVDTRIYAWPGEDDEGAPSRKVAKLLYDVPDLQLSQHNQLATDKGECGAQFVKKYIVFNETRDPIDLLKQPGFRTIIVGAKSQGVLAGVVARVPYEQDAGLYCHNLKNMQTQLQLLLEGLTIEPPGAASPAGAPPAGEAKPAGEAPAAAPPAGN